MSKEVTIEQKGINVWLITLPEPTNNEERVKSLPDVKKFIDNNIKENPYFQNHSGKCWYLVDKEIIDNTDYLKEMYLDDFIGKELLPDGKESLIANEYLNTVILLSSDDKELFKNKIKEGDEYKFVDQANGDIFNVVITKIRIGSIKNNAFYEVLITLASC